MKTNFKIRLFLIRFSESLAFCLLLPLLFWSKMPLPEYTSFTAPCQLLSFIPGYLGILLRRVWYRTTLRFCGSNLTVDWLAVIRTRYSEVGNRCTIGVANWIGWVRFGDDVMTGSHVTLTSGARQHGFDDPARPIREQLGQKQQIIVGTDVWIGAQAVVMADVSPGTVVGAGSVVTRQYPSMSVIAGNPARVLRQRGDGYQR
jgi:virginiamycin A acetyltransferase